MKDPKSLWRTVVLALQWPTPPYLILSGIFALLGAEALTFSCWIEAATFFLGVAYLAASNIRDVCARNRDAKPGSEQPGAIARPR